MTHISRLGTVYVLKNESIPGLYKIGHTTKSIEERVSQLSRSTSVPTDFEVIYKIDCHMFIESFKLEQGIHKLLASRRIDSKEFFRFDSDEQCIAHVGVNALIVCENLLDTKAGQSWLEARVCYPGSALELAYADEAGWDASIINREIMIIQSDSMESGNVELIAIIRQEFFLFMIGAMMLTRAGYVKNFYDGFECYISGGWFFRRWMSVLNEKLISD